MVTERFAKLRQMYDATIKLLRNKDREDAKSQKALDELAAEFKEFKLTPQFDSIVKHA